MGEVEGSQSVLSLARGVGFRGGRVLQIARSGPSWHTGVLGKTGGMFFHCNSTINHHGCSREAFHTSTKDRLCKLGCRAFS